VLVVVHRVHPEGALLGDGLPDVLDRFLDRRGLPDGHDVLGHEAPRGVFGILEDLLDLFRLLLFHQVQDLLGVLARELVDDVGRVLGRHPVEDHRDLDVVQGADELEQGGVVELGQDVAGLVGLERAEDRRAVGEGKLLEHVRDVGCVGFDERQGGARVVAILQQLFGCAEQALVRVHVVLSIFDSTGPRAR
jgi:hypothetical protein